MITYQKLREKFQKFFESKGHQFLPSASLVPENDPTSLFTTAGMQPLVPFLLGEKHPQGNKLANIQKCVRTGDVNEVGDASHLTFFEMMGNWSLQNAYWKKEAIEMSWEFLTSKEWLGLDKYKLAVSVFSGNKESPFDEDSYNAWKEIFQREGIAEKMIVRSPGNWWGLASGGPCGPDTEIFYWVGEDIGRISRKERIDRMTNEIRDEFFDEMPDNINLDDPRWLEIWNNVFMEFSKQLDGSLQKLKNKNVDTGMGLERILAILNNKKDVFDTELFEKMMGEIRKVFRCDDDLVKELEFLGDDFPHIRFIRIVLDHIRAAVFVLAEKIAPLNVGAGYILRRLIRRAIGRGYSLRIKENFLASLAGSVIETYKIFYPELERNKDFILEELNKEWEKFGKVFVKGREKLFTIKPYNSKITGKDLFYIFETFGFPLELALEELEYRKKWAQSVYEEGGSYKEEEWNFDKKKLKEEFEEEMKKHQELSRTASAGMFKGGLAGDSKVEKKYHTATHLLHAALRQILGEQVEQRGSNINAERLRFDFSYPQKLTIEQIKQVEDLVNEKIKMNLKVEREEMSPEEAKKSGAIGLFDAKYGERVSVYTVLDEKTGEVFSKEICMGPHAEKTGDLRNFKIIKEEAVSAGIRRIKAVLK